MGKEIVHKSWGERILDRGQELLGKRTFSGTWFPSITAPPIPVMRGRVAGMEG